MFAVALLAAQLTIPAAPRYAPNRFLDGKTYVFETVPRHLEVMTVAGIDVPLIGQDARCGLENRRGLAARRFAQAFLSQKRSIYFERVGNSHDRQPGLKDARGYALVRIRVGGRDLARSMILAGHAKPREQQRADWCRV